MLKQYIADNKLTVKHLLNTHLHLDHVFGNPFILREFGLKAEACQLDEFLLAKLPDQCRMFGFSPNEAPVGLGHYIEDGEIIRFGHRNYKPYMFRDIHPEAWYITVRQMLACSAVTYCFREA